jgi:hypothetical protein
MLQRLSHATARDSKRLDDDIRAARQKAERRTKVSELGLVSH